MIKNSQTAPQIILQASSYHSKKKERCSYLAVVSKSASFVVAEASAYFLRRFQSREKNANPILKWWFVWELKLGRFHKGQGVRFAHALARQVPRKEKG